MSNLLANRRSRLTLLLVVATAAITVVAFRAAAGSVSYYMTPAEYMADVDALEGTRVRVAGRVVEGSIVEVAGRPVAFDVFGDEDDRVSIIYEEGVVPNLFSAYALVVAEGVGTADGVRADNIIIKHEDEFWADTPPGDSISSHFVPDVEPE